MISKLFGVAVLTLPLALYPVSSNAESWKNWVEQNPTYQETPSQPPSAAPDSSQPQVLPTSPASGGNSAPAQAIELSTHHPLFVNQFMAGCEQDPRFASLCQCFLKEIQNTYTIDEIIKISAFVMENQELPSEMLQIGRTCTS